MVRALAVAAALALLGLLPRAEAQDKVLGKSPDEWMTLLKEHKEPKFRRAALLVLEAVGARSPGVLPALTAALENDADAQVRRETAMLLGRMGADAKGAAGPLADAILRDKDASVREAAASALAGKLNPFAADHLRALTEALSDTSAGVRASAAEALLKLGAQAAPAYARILETARDAKKDRFTRVYAVKIASRLGADRADALDAFAEILRDENAPTALREEAADGLARTTIEAKAAGPLADALADKAVEIRRAAAAGLAKRGEESVAVWTKIKPRYADPDQAVRYQLLRLAGKLGKASPEAIHQLLDSAKTDANVENRLAAIQELGEQPGDVPTEILQMLAADDTVAAVRTAADAALKKLASRQ